MGADPVAFGIAAVAATRGRPLRSFSVRKEAKDHGVTGRLAGALEPGDKVVITEDTVTRGSSIMEAVDAVQAVRRRAGGDPRHRGPRRDLRRDGRGARHPVPAPADGRGPRLRVRHLTATQHPGGHLRLLEHHRASRRRSGVVPGPGVARRVPADRARRRRGDHPHGLPRRSGTSTTRRGSATSSTSGRGRRGRRRARRPAGGRRPRGRGSSSGSSPPGRRPGFTLCDGVDLAARGAAPAGRRASGSSATSASRPRRACGACWPASVSWSTSRGWSFSDDVGWYKPAPEIFGHALGYLGVRARTRSPTWVTCGGPTWPGPGRWG